MISRARAQIKDAVETLLDMDRGIGGDRVQDLSPGAARD